MSPLPPSASMAYSGTALLYTAHIVLYDLLLQQHVSRNTVIHCITSKYELGLIMYMQLIMI
jgi:hypothetical protein